MVIDGDREWGDNRIVDVIKVVNRTAEIEELDSLLDDHNDTVAVVIVAGTPGVGKTSLAIRWANHIRHRFPDGQLYINLRGYDPGAPVTAEQALDRFLRALDIPAARIPAEAEAMADLWS